jgi:hypothetical protein
VNPSTADASEDDATVRKWIGFTKRNGGRGFVVGNVFSYRATDVKELASQHHDDMSVENSHYIEDIIEQADVLVPCWGNKTKVPATLRSYFDHLKEVLLSAGKPVLCFGTTKSGDPKHPLMLGYDTPLIDFGWREYKWAM